MGDIEFDFITNDRFRSSLEADYEELNAAMTVKAWKAVHVLAGSIIEAVLIDYLFAVKYNNLSEAAILKMSLDDAITACKNAGVLTDQAANLADVVRAYRNLIHPGRLIREKAVVDEERATIAQMLVRMIVSEITAKRKERYGYTAEQVVARLENNPSMGPLMLEQTFEQVKEEVEVRRLLLQVLPQRHLELSLGYADVEDEEGVLVVVVDRSGLEKGFRLAFEKAPERIKREVMARFVDILKEESESRIREYESAFFRGSDLRYCSPEGIKLIKEHIFLALSKGTLAALPLVNGFGEFLDTDQEVRILTEALINEIRSNGNADDVVFFIQTELLNLSAENVAVLRKEIEEWIQYTITYTPRRYSYETALLSKLLGFTIIEDLADEDIPF
jgi:hypothetical protein